MLCISSVGDFSNILQIFVTLKQEMFDSGWPLGFYTV